VSRAETDVWTLRRGGEGYPPALQDLAEAAPPTLFGRGRAELLSEHELQETVTIVGSRHPSSYGLEIAEELGNLLAAAGLVVVSGMALGIDAAVHRGALASGGSTIAVLGCGPDVVYPRSERRLYERILASGAVVSEVPAGTRPGPGCFPKRNRIMAALGAMTVVVEAAEPSGSLITAEQAQRLDREVGAVPGRVTTRVARGTNGLLADGAAVVRDAQDVLDRLLGVGAAAVRRAGPDIESELVRVADAVEGGAGTPDAVAVAARIGAGEAAVALARLELLGYVRADATGRYARTAMCAPEGGDRSSTLKA
jgi:DNA processing protein